MGKIALVPLSEKNIDAVYEIDRASFTHPWSYALLQAELCNEQAAYLVAEWEGTCAGYAGVQFACDCAEVLNIAVHPDFRRKGIGRALMQALAELAAQRGCEKLLLEVRASGEAAQALYRAQGFVTDGVRRGYYREPCEDAVLMHCDLAPAP